MTAKKRALVEEQRKEQYCKETEKKTKFIENELSNLLKAMGILIMSAEYERDSDGEEFARVNKHSGYKRINITGKTLYGIAFEVIYNL